MTDSLLLIMYIIIPINILKITFVKLIILLIKKILFNIIINLLQILKKLKKTLNFFNLRKILDNYVSDLHQNSTIYRHTLDYSVKLCIEMYKSLHTNFINGNIKHFNVKDLLESRRRFNLTLEPSNFNKKKNAFCCTILGIMKYDMLFKSLKLTHNIIFQYDKIKKEYYLLIPIDSKNNIHIFREDKCGIDIGVRTFMTIYSKNKCIEIGKNICKIIDKYNEKLDKLKSDYTVEKLSESKYNKTRFKYQEKINNKINDIHKKVGNYLLKTYETINIGTWFIHFFTKKCINTCTNTRNYYLFNIKKIINRGGRLVSIIWYQI